MGATTSTPSPPDTVRAPSTLGAALSKTAQARPRALLLYGLGWAVVLCGAVLWLRPSFLQHFVRAVDLADAVRAFRHGLPLLVAQSPHGALYPAARGDDPGIFILGQLLGGLTGIGDPLVLARLLLLVFFVPSVTLAPLLFRRITGSAAAALLAPVALVGAAFALEATPYWAGTWAVLGLIPVVLWVEDSSWRGSAGAVLVAVAALAGIASAIRAQSGLPVVLVILIALATRSRWRMWWRAGVGVLAVCAYLLVSVTALSAIERQRDHYRPIAAHYPRSPRTHTLWHNAYLGLGYLPNRHEIWWNDGVALLAAERSDPHVQFVTASYEGVIRKLTLDVIEAEPLFALSTYAKKAVVSVLWAAPLLLVLIATLPWALRLQPRRVRRLSLFAAPALLVGILPALIAIPVPEYLYGWLGALILMCTVTVSLTLVRAAQLLSHGRSLRSILLEDAFPRGRVRSLAAVGLLLAACGWGVTIRSQANEWAAQHGGDTAIVHGLSLPEGERSTNP